MEGPLRGVHIVVRSVEQDDLDIHQRIAGDHAVLRRLEGAFAHGRDELLGDRAADDLILEDLASAALQRADLDLDIGVLALTAGLALVG